jgi:hypothetical protein
MDKVIHVLPVTLGYNLPTDERGFRKKVPDDAELFLMTGILD